jgi:hypothetical protein
MHSHVLNTSAVTSALQQMSCLAPTAPLGRISGNQEDLSHRSECLGRTPTAGSEPKPGRRALVLQATTIEFFFPFRNLSLRFCALVHTIHTIMCSFHALPDYQVTPHTRSLSWHAYFFPHRHVNLLTFPISSVSIKELLPANILRINSVSIFFGEPGVSRNWTFQWFNPHTSGLTSS